MRPRASRVSLPLLFLLIAPLFFQSAHQSARADATIQYKAEFKAGSMIPASMLQQNAVTQKSGEPITSIVQLQGDQEYMSTGAGATQMPILVNFATGEVTIIDAAGKRYATGRLDDYLAQAQSASPSSASTSIPPMVKMILQQIRANFSSQKTGRTDSVLGIPISESVWTLTLEMPASALPLPGVSTGGANITLAKIVAHAWIANPNDVARNAALTEFSSRGSSLKYLYNPDTLLKGLADYPALQASFSSLLTSYMNKPPAVLKLDADIYLPVLAQVAPLLQAQGTKLPQGFDPNASLGTVSMQMTQLSDAPIDPSVFKVPAGYTSVPLSQFLNAPKPASSAPTPGSASAPSAPSQSASEKAARAAAVLRADK